MRLKEFRRGMIFKLDGEYWQILQMDLNTPGNKGSLYQVEMKNVKKGNVLRKRMSPTDDLEDVFTETREMEFLYRDGDSFVMMDTESYDQISMTADQVGDAASYMKHNEKVKVVVLDGDPVTVDLPAAVVLEVVETEPAARGNTVSGVTKPAKLETGISVKVPNHVNIGDRIKVDTRTGEFLSRA